MPPLPSQPGVLRIDHVFKVGEDLTALVRWHVTYTGTAPSDADLALFADQLNSQWVLGLNTLMPGTNSLEAIEILDLSTPTSAFGRSATAVPGASGGAELGAAVCLMTTYPIARRYRGGKPRNYWPFGFDSALSDPQTWSGAFIGNCTTFIGGYFNFTTLHVVGPATTGEMCSVSYYHGFTPVLNPITGRTRDVPTVRPAAIAPDKFLGLRIHPRPTTQRRRALNR